MHRIDTHQQFIPPGYRKALRRAGIDEAPGRALPDWNPEASLEAGCSRQGWKPTQDWRPPDVGQSTGPTPSHCLRAWVSHPVQPFGLRFSSYAIRSPRV